MLAVVVEVVDGLIGHQVAVVKEQTVEAQAIGQLQVVEDVPVVLSIEAQLVELYAGGRISLTIVSIGERNDLWRAVEQQLRVEREAIPHIIGSIETIVARTITHIHIISHLMLERHTGGQLVRIHIVSHVILDIPDGVVDGIVPSEQLITKRQVVVLGISDIDEWEF